MPLFYPGRLQAFLSIPSTMAVSRTTCLFLLLVLLHHSSASDTIYPNTSLSGNQKLTSKGGKFALGFYQPPDSSSSDTHNYKYYIAIWYNHISQITPVWIANRASPLSDPTNSRLTISSSGDLVLLDQSNSPVWSTSTSSTTTTTAILLNSGNLVLRDTSSNKTLWQSIDHPADTWLPGSKLAFNKLTGKSQRLTSWKNAADPSPGLFSLEADPDGSSQYIMQWNGTTQYWTSGTWNNGIFSLVPEMTAKYNFDFEYVTGDQENYFWYTVKDDGIRSRFIMDYSGQIKQLTWFDAEQVWMQFWAQPRAQCQVYALCGPFGSCNPNTQTFCSCLAGFRQRFSADWAVGDRSGGCVRNTQLICERNSTAGDDQDRFLQMPNVGLPVNNVSLNVGAGGCQAACLSNCSCTAYSSYNGCLVWFGELVNLQEDQLSGSGSTLYLRLAASELPRTKSKKGMVAGVIAGAVVLLIVLIDVLFVLVWRRRRRQMDEASKAVEGSLVSFRYNDLIRATKNFSERLGGGGFGSVFKGTLPDSTAIAVKKLEGLRQGEKQFRTEVSTIGTIQHVNMVRLHGFCSEGANKLLVYEYMPNGSLDTRLFEGRSVLLDWNKRYQIALGTARGLLYLHERCRDCIIHCDIKPENILLDESFIPKVADFGLAKLVGRDFSRVLTTMRGTRGYLAPEWLSGLAITPKADVYSFGMMLLELVSGRRNSEAFGDGKFSFFPKLAAASLKEGNFLTLLDQRLEEDANLEEITRACKVACWCIQDDEYSRPTMGQVVQNLEGILEISMPPVPRSLHIYGDSGENIVFFSGSS